MTFKEDLKARLQGSRNTPYMLFITRYDRNSSTQYIFCESTEDIIFYRIALQRGHPKVNFSFISCNGKGGVLQVRGKLRQAKYDHLRISYIVDADHDRYSVGPREWGGDIYATDFYSVEAYLVCPQVFISCLQQHSGLQDDDPTLRLARNWYAALDNAFVDAMREPMSIAIQIRRQFGPDAVHFDGVALHNFLRIPDIQTVSTIACLSEAIIKLAGKDDNREAIRQEAKHLEASFAHSDPREWIRGKFSAWWFVETFNLISRKLKAEYEDQNRQKINCGLNLSPKAFIPVLAHHAEVPKSLAEFFAKRLALAAAA